MMIVDLNLLPPTQKIKLNRLVQILFARNMLETIAIGLCILATILLWSYLVLINEFNELTKSALLIGRDYTSYNQEVRQINRVVKNLTNTTYGYFPISDKILEFISTTPNNIKLNIIDIDRSTNKFYISGTAKTRSDLLAYHEFLKSIPWLKPANMPTSQLLQKENINFDYQTQTIDWPPIRTIQPKQAPKPIADDSEL